MATTATIAIYENDKIRQVYCNSDGYPSHTGRLLLGIYNNSESINELFEQGDIAVLYEHIDYPLEDEFEGDISRFYYRDHHESIEDTIAKEYDDLEDYLAKVPDRRMLNYLFINDRWYVSGICSDEQDIDQNTWFLLDDSVVEWCWNCIHEGPTYFSQPTTLTNSRRQQ